MARLTDPVGLVTSSAETLSTARELGELGIVESSGVAASSLVIRFALVLAA
jgi:hypothetical protein